MMGCRAVYVLSIGLAGFMLYFICGLAAGGSSTTPAAAPGVVRLSLSAARTRHLAAHLELDAS